MPIKRKPVTLQVTKSDAIYAVSFLHNFEDGIPENDFGEKVRFNTTDTATILLLSGKLYWLQFAANGRLGTDITLEITGAKPFKRTYKFEGKLLTDVIPVVV